MNRTRRSAAKEGPVRGRSGRGRTVRRSVLLGSVAGAVVLGRQMRRWTDAHDPTDGKPLDDLADLSPTVKALITADGTELYVKAVGPSITESGAPSPVFVLAHCWTGDSRIWGPVARRLAQAGNRVVLYDHRGHGRSGAGQVTVDLAVLAADLAAVLEHVDADNVVLVGHSLGGMTVQHLAASPGGLPAGRVGAVVLVDSSPTIRIDPVSTRYGARVLADRRTHLPMAIPVLAATSTRGFFGADPALSHLLAVAETYRGTDPAARASLLMSMQAMDLHGALASCGLPVTVVVGARDLVTPVSAAKAMADSCPGAKVEVVPHAGHMLPLERPDLLTELLVEAARTVPAQRSAS